MKNRKPIQAMALLLTLALFAVSSFVPKQSFSQQIPLSQHTWSADVIRPRGQPLIPLFDGWFPNNDGSRSLCFGYMNLNTEQSFDIPVGAQNFLADANGETVEAMQPTHFEPVPPSYRHRFCVFTVQVPADFARDEKIIWTLSSSGQTLSVPGHTLPAYVMDEPISNGRGNIAPLVRLAAGADGVRGRNGIQAENSVNIAVGQTTEFPVWLEHPNRQVWVGWSKHRGPGHVTFDMPEFNTPLGSGPVIGRARFSKPGNYLIRMQSIHDVAAFEFYCCHTNAYFEVNVSE